jgi:hypothetical protein
MMVQRKLPTWATKSLTYIIDGKHYSLMFGKQNYQAVELVELSPTSVL